ncbi:MAG TPA: ribosome-associated translation inhibitor RaiA [Acidimicrobiales bacterium]|jgi:putative sigma-54 modulation protein|nr:ribosome-associated translation inhibitor RaiA [Acidimicrobiales bacterium]
MEITVSGRHIEVSDKLRSLTEQKVNRLDRFLDMERAEVHFTRHRNSRVAEREMCEITLEGHGHHVRTKVSATDQFVAVDKAVDKLGQQLARLKSKLVGRSRGVRPARPDAGAAVPAAGAASAEPATGGGEGAARPAAGGADATREPKIVKSKRFAMMPMTAEEAVVRMELLGHGFFFFTNADTSRAAVVYARDDGDIGLIDEAG